jgi:hypothetical protein
MRWLTTACATALSARAHSGAQRAARPSRGDVGTFRPAHAADGARRAAARSGRPRPRFGLSFRSEVDEERLDELEVLKAKAQETSEPQVVVLGDCKTLVQPSGWASYRYWLRCGDFDVFVGRGKRLPAVYARLASSFIHEVGASSALAELSHSWSWRFYPRSTKRSAHG